MNSTIKDEFVVDRSVVYEIVRNHEKLERLFDVGVTFGEVSKDGDNSEKQWVILSGKPDDRVNAKEYIVALCQPDDRYTMKYPSKSVNISHLEKIEKQTHASIRVSDGCKSEITISGTDLAVTLAMSALEDLIDRQGEIYHSPEDSNDKSQKRLSSEAAVRLDTRFERALSQHSDGSLNPEDYQHTYDAVKRAMLQCWSEDSNMGAGYGERDHSTTINQFPNNGKQVEHVPSKDIRNLGNQVDVLMLDSTKGPDVGKVEKTKFDLREFAQQCGYADIDIGTVLDSGPPNMTPKEFLQKLYENKKKSQPATAIQITSSMEKTNKSKVDMTNRGSEVPAGSNSGSEVPAGSKSGSSFTAGNSSTFADSPSSDYWQRLARDFQEEDDYTDITELKQRNAERQELIKTAIKQRKELAEGEPQTPPAGRSQSKSSKKKRKKSASPSVRQNGKGSREVSPPTDQAVLVDLTNEDPSQNRLTITDDEQTHLLQVWPHHYGREQRVFSERDQDGGEAVRADPLRHVIIDGSNVAMEHGNHKVFSCYGILLCVNYFLNRGHKEVTAFVPQWRQRMPTHQYPISQQELLKELKDRGHLVFTPSKKVAGKNIVCYDDRFILQLAEQTDGVVVSNDNYRDLLHEKPAWNQLIKERVLMYSFVGDIFMPPDDPLGRDGPTLDNFLSKSAMLTTGWQTSSPQRYNLQGRGRQAGNPQPFRKPNQPQQQQQVPSPLSFRNYNQQQQQRSPWQPKQGRQTPVRSQEETDHLATLLRSLFPNRDQEEKIQLILRNHKSETNVDRLSNLIMDICK